MKAKELDQFYTDPQVALELTRKTVDMAVDCLGYDASDLSFVEPSAGEGAFLDAANSCGYSIRGYDIDPQDERVIYNDFLSTPISGVNRDSTVILGNPPFGKRARLALSFINKAFDYVDTVAFIVPNTCERYLTQKNIRVDARLVYSEKLEPNIFTLQGKSCSIRCVFQVWTLREGGDDVRIRQAPPTKHHDFTTATYNCTPQAEKYFDEEWDFVILRQGWGDMTPIKWDGGDSLDRKKQWMFFRAHSDEARERLLKIDYSLLSERNTSVRGFGKADVVEAYNSIVED